MNKIFKKAAAAVLAGMMIIASFTMSAFAEDEAAKFDPNGEYDAYLLVQFNGSWVFRNSYSEASYGGINKDFQYSNQLCYIDDATKEAVPKDGTFTDAKLKGNGTYTITLEGPDVNATADKLGTGINLIGITTNMPADAAEIVKFTDVKIVVNDSAVTTYTYPEGTADEEKLEKEGYVDILGVNTWNDKVCADANALLGGDDNFPPAGVSKISVTFTVSGFANDNPDAVAPTEPETTTAAPAADNNNTTATTTAAAESSSNGLPTVAIIGIVAGVAIVVIVIIVVAVTASKKKKNN